MNDYQQKRVSEYILPQAVYRQALWAVKDLERLRERKRSVEENAGVVRGIDYGRQISLNGGMIICDNTARYAIEESYLSARISAIESAFDKVPEEYRKGIYEKLVNDIPYKENHCTNTWKKWQQIFLYNVAVNLNLL